MHNFTDFSTPDKEYITSRFREQIEALQKVFDIARENDATLIIGGDIFHKRGSVKTEVFNKVFELVERNYDVDVLMLRGNHDAVTNSLYTSSSIEPFGVLSNVTVINEPEVMNYPDSTRILFLPYGDETEEMKKFINEEAGKEKDRPTILVAHIGVEGASQGKHSHRLSGAFGYGDLAPEYFDYILLGHYHKRQLLGTNPKHLYGGSFMQHNFGDEGQDKGVHLIDSEEGTIDFIPIETTKFRTITTKDNIDDIEGILDSNFVRFIGSSNELKALDKLKDSDNGQLHKMRVELQRDYQQEARMGLDASMSEEDIVKAFAEQKFPDAIEEALECLQEAR